MAGIPDYIERKGSLFLRSNHMNYGRATLNSNWHQAREAEPKDYDISKGNERNLCTATYERIGNITDGSLNKTTYQDHAEQTNLKKDFEEQIPRKPMMTMNTVEHSHIDRDLGTPQRGFGSVLPRHNPEYNKMHLETTNKADYQPPDPEYTPVPEKPADFPDLSAAYRKCNSQFTDTADYRRPGRNTWQDESGVYTNTHYKRQVLKTTNPIPPQIS
ncbi:cilia- and flagella-associated protein 95-like [Ostrea edulis]|uniref:cilia- and flagella-associated protein 95-like n=1 Tax=Ostrea edulis TaxID=37623 RepID=UPI002094C805|nr:cilia- and flagella-associated protein 95-like [Ostrea edulis]